MNLPFFDVALWAAFTALVAGLASAVARGNRVCAGIGAGALALSALAATLFKVHEWIDLQRPPFATTFEVLTFLALALAIVYLVFDRLYRTTLVGPIVAALVVLILAYATLFRGAPAPLMPALQNNFWLTLHVVLCFVGYAAFFFSFALGLVHLVALGGRHRQAALALLALTLSALLVTGGAWLATRSGWIALVFDARTTETVVGSALCLALALFAPARALLGGAGTPGSPNPESVELLLRRSVAFGFPLLGLGIITGAVWAHEAWGRFWGWDPKETWSLVSWIIYFLYLHTRYARGWSGPRSSWFAVAGFYAVVFTFFGVSYLLPGLHSYLG